MSFFGFVVAKDISTNKMKPRIVWHTHASKCAICGRPYYNYSNMIMYRLKSQGYYLDGRPEEYYSNDIEECPRCHYCNFNLYELADSSFLGHTKKERIQMLNRIALEQMKEENDDLRKLLVLESVTEDEELKVDLLLKAAWFYDKDKASEIRAKAFNIFRSSLYEHNKYYVKVIDSLRQESEFEKAEAYLNLIKNSREYKIEKALIDDKDNKKYTLYSAMDKYGFKKEDLDNK